MTGNHNTSPFAIDDPEIAEIPDMSTWACIIDDTVRQNTQWVLKMAAIVLWFVVYSDEIY